MLKIDPQQGSLVAYARPALAAGRLATRHRLDDLIVSNSETFFRELRRPLMLLGRLTDFNPSADRSVLLAADPSGRLTVMALQDETGAPPDLVEALQAAESISGWAGPDILACMDPAAAEAVQARLRVRPQSLNCEQRVMLLAESFDADALATTAWLTQRYGVAADCVRVSLVFDERSSDEFLLVEDLGVEAEALHLSGWADLDPTPWPDAVPDISDAPPSTAAVDFAPVPKPTSEPETVDTEPTPPGAPPDWEAEFQAAIDDPAEQEAKRAEASPAVEATPAAVQSEPMPLEPVTSGPQAIHDSSPLTSPLPDFIPEFDLDDDFEDPLADVIEAREQAEAAAAEPHQPGSERREAERSDAYQARRLRLNYFGRLLGARLVDFSDKGIGVEALSPLPVGAEIGVSGELVSDERVIALEGRARVRHSKPNADGVCRIGFSIDPNVVKEVDSPETFERR